MHTIVVYYGRYATLEQTIVFAVILTIVYTSFALILYLTYKWDVKKGVFGLVLAISYIVLEMAMLSVAFYPFINYARIVYNSTTNTTFLYKDSIGAIYAQWMEITAIVVVATAVIEISLVVLLDRLKKRRHRFIEEWKT